MKNLKFFLSVLIGFYFVSANACITFIQKDQDPNLLYKKAVLAKDLPETISLAKLALRQAEKQNSKIIQVSTLNLIAESFRKLGTNDSAKNYSQRALKLSQKNKIDSLQADSWVILGLIDHKDNAYNKAIEKYQNAIALYKKDNNLIATAVALNNIGICERKLSRYKDAIANFMKSATIFENLMDSNRLAATYNSVALCFVSLKNYPKAIFYNQKTLSIREKLGDNRTIAQSWNNIGFAYKEYKKPDSAIFFLDKCLFVRSKEKDSNILVIPLQNLAEAWQLKKNLSKSRQYVLRSLQIATKYNMQEELASGNLILANIYIDQGQYKKALSAINITEPIAQKLNIPDLLVGAYTTKYKLYQATADYKNAIFYLNKKNELNDSLFTLGKDRAISELEIKYQTSQKEKAIASLHLQNTLQQKIVGQQKNIIFLLIITAILFLGLLAFAYYSFKAKHKANLHIQTLMQDLHHRVKNNLQILAGLFSLQINSLVDEDTKNTLRENEARLTSMNLIHNTLYMDHTTTQIDMEEYLTKLLQHIKEAFSVQYIDFRINIDKISLEADKAVAIGLIVNELVTNAIKHAFNGKTGEITLSIQLESKKKVVLCLSDNGKGLRNTDQKQSSSFGLKLVKLMVRQLNAELTMDQQNGTRYQIEINI